jgi:hypothetical protein
MIERATRRYPADITGEEGGRRTSLPSPAKREREPGVDLREVLNTTHYITRTDGACRMLPSKSKYHAAPYFAPKPHSTVYAVRNTMSVSSHGDRYLI